MQVAALVVGHVAGLAIAHDRAVVVFEGRRRTLEAQLPDARPDGAVYARRDVAADAWLVAHGGLAGAIVEASLALALVGVLVAVWLRERRADRDDQRVSLGDEEPPG